MPATIMQTSTTYNSFMYLSLPMPSVKGPSKTSLQSCLDAFVKEEVLSGTEAWYGIAQFYGIVLMSLLGTVRIAKLCVTPPNSSHYHAFRQSYSSTWNASRTKGYSQTRLRLSLTFLSRVWIWRITCLQLYPLGCVIQRMVLAVMIRECRRHHTNTIYTAWRIILEI